MTTDELIRAIAMLCEQFRALPMMAPTDEPRWSIARGVEELTKELRRRATVSPP